MIQTNKLISSQHWLARRIPKPEARVQLICIPYAGGGIAAFHAWPDLLPNDVEVSVVRLPGRDGRVGELPIERFDELLERLYEALCQRLDRPVALFGYSMGGLFAFELARRLDRQGFQPLRLMVGACAAQHSAKFDIPSPDEQCTDSFLQGVERVYGPLPTQVMQDSDLKAMFARLLRADNRLIASYSYKPGPSLTCPISAFGGDRDLAVSEAGVRAWSEQTTSRFSYQIFSGDHFFLRTHRQSLLRAIAKDLQVNDRLLSQ
jgi:surfactin synthase thioesterase subunit